MSVSPPIALVIVEIVPRKCAIVLKRANVVVLSSICVSYIVGRCFFVICDAEMMIKMSAIVSTTHEEVESCITSEGDRRGSTADGEDKAEEEQCGCREAGRGAEEEEEID